MQSVQKSAGTQPVAENTPWAHESCSFSKKAWDVAQDAAHLSNTSTCSHLCFTLASAAFESSWMPGWCGRDTQLFLLLERSQSKKKYTLFCCACGGMACERYFVRIFRHLGVPDSSFWVSGGSASSKAFSSAVSLQLPLTLRLFSPSASAFKVLNMEMSQMWTRRWDLLLAIQESSLVPLPAFTESYQRSKLHSKGLSH